MLLCIELNKQTNKQTTTTKKNKTKQEEETVLKAKKLVIDLVQVTMAHSGRGS